ncbi:hypothetical protein UA08_06447 [Talaromyces atroroseus]|uniref:Fructose-bisphosphate aldolase n=1 Tax=Talaromyces atroroseus TaxID=1441469 RepID=A0A225AXB9_TALAT|nr:hypothetical protein UA08_06447 [Talaromyces atroroseus]OKL58147.1 hypothetical protein UA08_06447 [Talaromyces atroroseus]
MSWKETNKTLQILRSAEEGGYGVIAAIAYNVEHVTAFVQAANNRKSPIILQLFPSSLKLTPSLVYAAAAAARLAAVPIAVHLDHAQDEEQIKYAADHYPFDSIMVDMSHYERAENIEKTRTLKHYCHSKQIAVEAETGRIEGGEDGIMDTGDLAGILTSAEDVEDFISADVDAIAPSVGNIHGDYGARGPQLDFESVYQQINKRARLVLHGTNDFTPELMKSCVQAGVSKINVNKLLLAPWQQHIEGNIHKPLTQVMQEGIEILTKETERWMDIVGSSAIGLLPEGHTIPRTSQQTNTSTLISHNLTSTTIYISVYLGIFALARMMSGVSSRFVAHDGRFNQLLGGSPKIELLAENNVYPFAHEAGVYIKSTNELFVTSNRFGDKPDTPSHLQRVQISKIIINDDDLSKSVCEEIDSSAIPMGNGGVNYKDGILFCGQGYYDKPSGLYEMSATAPYNVRLLISDFYGRDFNSVNDVIVHEDGSIWFTDPPYGFEQNYRPPLRLPPQLYRYNPITRNIRAMADGFGHPNGLCFAPDEKTLYVTDTDWLHGSGKTYAFDIITRHGEPFLANRRLFAMTESGIPDGIKCDMEGNVYSGCGDGVHVWSPGGVLLGKIMVGGLVANFCFGRNGDMFLLNENRIWRVKIGEHVQGALLKL